MEAGEIVTRIREIRKVVGRPSRELSAKAANIEATPSQKEDLHSYRTLCISVPSFFPRRQFVLLDLQTLDSYNFQIDCSSLTGSLSEKERALLQKEELEDLELTPDENEKAHVEFDDNGEGS